MESIYLRAEEEVRRRRQQLNLLRGIRGGLTVSLGLTALYGISWVVGLWGTGSPSGWLFLLGNALGAGLGALWGRRQPVPLADDLYRVDRALRLDERLVTLYELRRRGETELRRALYRQLDDLRGRLDPEHIRQALPLPPRERRAWLRTAGLALLSVGILGLWIGGFGPVSWEKLLSGAPLSEIGNAPVPPPEGERLREQEEEEEQGAISQSLGDPLVDEARRNLCRRDRAAATTLTEEQWAELCAEPEGTASSSPSEGATEANSAVRAQAIGDALAWLLERLVSGEISAEQARSELRSLQEEVPPGELREALERAAQAAEEQELRERIQEALSQLAQRPPSPPPGSSSESQPASEDPPSQGPSPGPAQASPDPSGTSPSAKSQGPDGSDPAPPSQKDKKDEDEEEDKDEEEGAASARPADDEAKAEAEESEDSQASASTAGESPDSDGTGEEAEETGSNTGESGAEGESEPEPEPESESPSQAKSGEVGTETGRYGSDSEGGGEGTGFPEGSESPEPEGESEGDRPASGIGTGEGPDAAETPPQPWQRLSDGLLIRSGDLPQDVQLLYRLLAKGLPVDLAGQGEDGAPVVVLNLARFESLLAARDLPPELRALVRAYFLAIAEGQGKKTEKGGKP